MTTLRDPFDVIHKKDIKNKAGEVVAKVDYVGWSQVADRLDEAAASWSFEIRQLGDDWCWGRLTVDGRTFENVGYAENAEAAWKKEALKDAVSDALKRCAAMAGVARYLYDKDAPAGPQNGRSAPRPVAVAPTPVRAAPVVPARSSTEVPEPPLEWDVLSDKKPEPFGAVAVLERDMDGSMTAKELFDRADTAQVPVDALAQASKKLYGPKAWSIKALTDLQRYAVAIEVGLA